MTLGLGILLRHAWACRLVGSKAVRGQWTGWLCLQRSLEDEVSRTTAQDLPVFAVSYLVIFLYISLALGSYTSCSRVPVSRGRGTARGI